MTVPVCTHAPLISLSHFIRLRTLLPPLHAGAGTACLGVRRKLGAQEGNFWTSMQQHLGRRPPGSVSAGGYSQELLLRRVNIGARRPAREQVCGTT